MHLLLVRAEGVEATDGVKRRCVLHSMGLIPYSTAQACTSPPTTPYSLLPAESAKGTDGLVD
jgi:hypothetical protein